MDAWKVWIRPENYINIILTTNKNWTVQRCTSRHDHTQTLHQYKHTYMQKLLERTALVGRGLIPGGTICSPSALLSHDTAKCGVDVFFSQLMVTYFPALQAVVFLFRFGHDGSSMVVTMADAERVLDTASKTRLCRREPQLLLDVFMENCGAGEEKNLQQAILLIILVLINTSSNEYMTSVEIMDHFLPSV